MIITIPFKTPTINHLYTRNRYTGGKCLTNEANKLKKEIRKIVDKILSEHTNSWPSLYEKPLGVDVAIFEDWYCKNESVKKKDVANREKFLIDAVFDALGIDDKYIFYNSIRKVQSKTEEKAVITIEVL